MRRTPKAVDDPDDGTAAEAAALRLLNGAAQSADALERKLRQRGFSRAATHAAVERCRELGYVDDAAFAASLVRRHVSAGHGAARVIADMRRRGIGNAAATEALGTIDDDQQDRAAAALAQKLYDREARRGALDERVRARIAAALQRRGFNSSAIQRALSAVQTDASTADDDS